MSILTSHSKTFVAERIVDQPALRLEQVADVGLEQLRGLAETLFEFVEEAHGGLRDWEGDLGDCMAG